MIKNNNISEFLILIPFALKAQNSVKFYIIIFVFIKKKLVEVVVVTVILIVSVEMFLVHDVHETFCFKWK